MRLGIVITLLVLSMFSFAFINPVRKYGANVKIEKVVGKKKIIIESLNHYDLDLRKLACRYSYPEDYYLFLNEIGEAKFYYPKSNEVQIIHSQDMSAISDALYYFFTENYSDMGLKSLGYKILTTAQENGMVVTDWVPSVGNDRIAKIRLVLKDYVPIYSAFYNQKDKIIQKIFYDNYIYIDQFYVPSRIIEYMYMPTGDSIISRKQYSNIHKLLNTEDNILGFEIPLNAKNVKK